MVNIANMIRSITLGAFLRTFAYPCIFSDASGTSEKRLEH